MLGDLPYVADGNSGLRAMHFGPEYRAGITVGIGIRPRSDTNAIAPLGRGLIPVTLLGSQSFDVAQVDVTTLAFGPDAATPGFDLTNPWCFSSVSGT